MSYPKDLHNFTDLQNLLFRKEFASLKLNDTNPETTNELFLDDKILKERKLILHSHQKFVRNFMNPNTPYTRLLLKHMTGTGKTIAAIAIALTFIEYYKKQYIGTQDDDSSLITPTVFVVGIGIVKKSWTNIYPIMDHKPTKINYQSLNLVLKRDYQRKNLEGSIKCMDIKNFSIGYLLLPVKKK